MAGFQDDRATHLSDTIKIARILCILGVVYVHAWTGLPWAELTAIDSSPQGIFRWSLMEVLGRSAVPLLSLISGWLVAQSAMNRGYGAFMLGKWRNVLQPMILWNAIAIVLIAGSAEMGWIAAPMAGSLWWVIDELLCLVTPDDINVQMSFLRDLFVCMAFAPLLVRLPGWALGLLMGVVAAWAISLASFVLLIRPVIALFFITGILVRRHGLEKVNLLWAVVLPPFVALAMLKIWLATQAAATGGLHPHLMMALDILGRVAGALLFWKMAGVLARRPIGAGFRYLERYAFLMFCCHLILIWIFGPLIGQLTGPAGSPLYPVFLLVQPALILGATILIGKGLLQLSPAAAAALSGGRLRREDHGPPPRPEILHSA